jgi:hypothetical protein
MKTLPCQKRRRVIKRSKDGGKKEVYRCANGTIKNYRSDVDESVCKACVLRRPLLAMASTCKEPPPSNPIWPEPHYEAEDIIYFYQKGIQEPPVPQGYKRKSEEDVGSWQFESQWGKCSYRQLMNERTSKGNVQIHAYCTVRTNYIVKHEECKQCLSVIAEMDGILDEGVAEDNFPLPESIERRLNEKGIPNYPGAAELLDNYWKAVKRWITAGRPTREDAEVRKIHEEFCDSQSEPCSWYDPELQRCKGCGCSVRPKGITLLNKIKMKTEHCPRHLW